MGNRRNWVMRGVDGVLKSVRREKGGKLIHRFLRGRVLEDNAECALTLNHPPPPQKLVFIGDLLSPAK